MSNDGDALARLGRGGVVDLSTVVVVVVDWGPSTNVGAWTLLITPLA